MGEEEEVEEECDLTDDPPLFFSLLVLFVWMDRSLDSATILQALLPPIKRVNHVVFIGNRRRRRRRRRQSRIEWNGIEVSDYKELIHYYTLAAVDSNNRCCNSL